MNIKIKYYLLCLIQLTPLFGANQNYTFRQIKVEDGLSQSTIHSIIQDKKGYMWFGTGNGLNKYDGYSFVIYSNVMDDNNSISSNVVTSMFEDSKGILWTGTVDGILNRFNRETETFTRFRITDGIDVTPEPDEQFYDYPVSFSRNNNNTLTSITEDDKGFLWAGTWGKGLVKFDPGTGRTENFYHSSERNSLSHNRITRLLKDSDGNIWVGTLGGGLNRIIQTAYGVEFESFKHNQNDPESISDNRIISLFQDLEGDIWIGTYSRGLNRISVKDYHENRLVRFINYKKESEKNSIASNSVMSIIQDRLGYIWIGTFGGGLDRFDKNSGEFLNFKKNKFDDNSLADNDVLIIFEDRSGIIWIGTHLGRGISILERNKIKFRHLKNSSSENSLNDDVVWSIYKDKKNTWVGTYRGGLNRINEKGKFSFFMNNPTDPNSISDNHIRSILKDFDGNLWVGTYGQGLNKFNPLTGKSISYKFDPHNKNSIGGNQVLSMLMDPDSVLWIGIFGGGLNYVKSIKSGKLIFNKYKNNPDDPSSLSDNRVYSLFRTRDGIIWVGTFGGGLNRLDSKTGKFKRYMSNPNDTTSISHDRIMAVYEDKKGRMWISTYGGGLNYFDRKTEKFKVYTRKQGLQSDVIYGVLEDNSGNLWISTDNGLFKFYPDSERFLRFDIDDGLQSQEFSGGAYFKSADGELYFGGINGINYFYPENIVENTNIPPVEITSIKVAGELHHGETTELELSYNENILTFEFAALDFTNPVDNHYEYILEGLESEWQKIDAKYRIANYTNLSPGTYYFKVKGSNNDEIWNTQPAVIKITILPPFWKTWWFLTIAMSLAAIVIYYLSTVRIRNLLTIEKLKTKLAADLHDNIGAGLTEISILSELASSEAVNSGKLQTISETARQLVDNMSDIVWVVNPKRDSLHDLLTRINDSYADILSGLGISLKTSNLEKIEDVKLTMEYKQNLFMVLKEGINNAIKHSGCKKISIEANIRNDIIEIVLKDDGIGFQEGSIQFGNGIKNIEARAKALGAKVKWRSLEGKGTILIFIGNINSRRNLLVRIKNLKELI